MNDPATASDQTAVLIAHTAAFSRSTNEPDSRPIIVQAVENWNRVLSSDTGRDQLPEAHPSSDVDRHRLDAAARRALRIYPGPAGQLIHRELVAAADLGYRHDLGHRTDHGALLLRLAEHVLASVPADSP